MEPNRHGHLTAAVCADVDDRIDLGGCCLGGNRRGQQANTENQKNQTSDASQSSFHLFVKIITEYSTIQPGEKQVFQKKISRRG
jgi:hypothetical protein